MFEHSYFQVTLVNWEQTRILKQLEAVDLQSAINKALEYAKKELFQVDSLTAKMIYKR